jgi:hypothetical protein
MLKHMRLLVDTFHYGSWRGGNVPIHKCPTTFDTKNHEDASQFNSQYEEHGNAFVSLHKRSARTMRLQRAYELISALLRAWNGVKEADISGRQEAWAAQYAGVCTRLAWPPAPPAQ